MLYMFLKDLGVSSALCLGERVLERMLFPGLHHTAGRIAAADPSRVDDLATLFAEALGLLAMVWLFNGSLYAISLLGQRPLRPYATTLVTTLILVLVLAGSGAEWATMPAIPP
jgi:hypothetical protein